MAVALRAADLEERRKGEIIGGVLARLAGRLQPGEAALAERFVRLVYRDVAAEDLAERGEGDLYGAALALFRFGQERRPGAPKVRAYNPRLEQHGWQSVHTIVEVVNDDMPFLVDSVGMELQRRGLGIHLVIHPLIKVTRDAAGRLGSVVTEGGADGGANGGAATESFMHIEVDRQSDPAVLGEVEAGVARVLGDVRAAVSGWAAMRDRAGEARRDLAAGAGRVPPDDLAECEAFLDWLAGDHFTFVGYSTYELERDAAGGTQLRRIKGTGLGILKGYDEGGLSRSFASLPAEVREQAREPHPVVAVAKAHARSTVHRATYLDFIGVKRFGPDGEVLGEHRFLGLFTSAAYSLGARSIPLLRRKVATVLDRAGHPADSHAGKALAHILETYPRDELFQTDEDGLLATATEILRVQDRQKLRLFLRPDRYGRFVACLIHVPRDRYSTGVRERMRRILVDALGGAETEFQTQIGEASLARLLVTVRTPDGPPAEVDVPALERQLVEASQAWSDRLRAALIADRGEEEGNRLFDAFGRGMPASFEAAVEPRLAVPDVLELDRLASAPEGRLGLSLHRRLEDGPEVLRLKLARRDRQLLLSDALPILENMGLRVLAEQPHEIRARDGSLFFLHDFELRARGGEAVDVEEVREVFADAFARVWSGAAESDGFNRLVLLARLDAPEVAVLRAYCKYLMQIGTPFSQAYIEETLTANPALARCLAELFRARFDPAAAEEGREARAGAAEAALLAGLEAVQSLDQDRILRRYLGLIRATQRTNHFRRGEDGGPRPCLSLKFASREVPGMPAPAPLFEVFVYAPDFEAIHLRGGKVARGGIRWSDRREDFRTEVLGLMKAQMVKNSVIVPVGAKGGFVLKRPPAGNDRARLQEEAVRCYRLFLSGLLDVTDNLTPGGVAPPPDVVRHDADDPYLVVAADKGTATFSDYANAVSVSYGFWLGDAFASGGSAGYDHKAMGITARGAWESVKRHFREMGLDPARDPFTVAGIGDMSGDVFGNGMLLSDRIRLVAAFDHRHVFLDPDPDPAASFEERRRLFALPRSSWEDYDRAKLSEGAGIYPRTAKRVEPSPEACRALGIAEGSALTPAELISAILKAPVDLLWNGGIGTYVKARDETHHDAQDRANDAIRVDGEDLRCKVLGEGGNLGLTQAGRVAYALNGGRICTDFIDNSAGVDCSDHEVNIKVLLQDVVAAGDMTLKQRDQLLAGMTDEVGELVLRDNVLQNLALSMGGAVAAGLADPQVRLMRKLEATGRLDRALDGVPPDEALLERARQGRGLTRPEAAVLLALSKMELDQRLLATDLPDRPYLAEEIRKYFPRELRRRFGDEIGRHRLKREIVSTWLANSMVNRGLEVFVSELEDETGAGLEEIALAYVIARDAFALPPTWTAIEALPASVPADRQVRLLLDARELLARGTRWFLAHGRRPLRIGDEVGRFRPGIAAIVAGLRDGLLAPGQAEALAGAAAGHEAAGVPADLARAAASFPVLLGACDIVTVVEERGAERDGDGRLLERAARAHFAIAELLDLGWLAGAIAAAPRRSGWDRLALAQLDDEMAGSLRALTRKAVDAGAATAEEVAAWAGSALRGLERYRAVAREIGAGAAVDLAMLSVAVRTLGELARGR